MVQGHSLGRNYFVIMRGHYALFFVNTIAVDVQFDQSGFAILYAGSHAICVEHDV